MKLILHYLKRYKLLLLLNVISVMGFALVELGIPTIVADMIDIGVAGQDIQYLWNSGGRILAIAIIGVIGTISVGYCCAKISTSVTRDIRNDIFAKVQSFSHSEFSHFGVSSLITRTNNDAFQIQMFVNVILRTAMMTPIMIGVSFFMVIRTSLDLSYVIGATVPIIIIGVILVAKYSQPISTKQQSSLDSMNRISRENLTGIRVIRAFNTDEHETERFNRTNNEFTGHTKAIFKLMSVTGPIFFLLMNFAGLIIFWIASTQINAGILQVGKLVAFMDYLFHAMFSVMLFCTVFMMYPRAEVSARRIKEIFDEQPLIANSKKADMPQHEDAVLEFRNVTFSYPDGEESVLHDVSFEARTGETIAFIGSTGSGKSTLINLIPRFYDISSGSIRYNGVDIREFNLDDYRKKIGFIAQKAMLFSGTIEENIRFGKLDASEDEIIHAAKVAQAYDFIMEKPLQFNEPITEGATNVSGGQKQRLSIARALIRKPEIYIFDDSFSALDFKTDAALRHQLKKETRQSIVFIVAQRVSSIMDADKIIVLNEGKVVDSGSHRELLKRCDIYHEIAASQLSEEELNHD